jgi:hypothetical protein
LFSLSLSLSLSAKNFPQLDILVCTYNSSIEEAKAGESGVQGQPRLHNDTLFKKKEKKPSMPHPNTDYITINSEA